MRIPSDAVHVEFGEGEATLHVSGQHVRDFISIPNSLKNGASDPATVSYTVHWSEIQQRRRVNNSMLHVSGRFLDTLARIEWTGHNDATGFTFTASEHDQHVISAQLAHMRNGVFFD